MSSLRRRIDPELLAGLDAYIGLAGPRGFLGIEDPIERRRAYAGFEPGEDYVPDARVQTEDLEISRVPGEAPVRVRSYRPVGADGILPAVLYLHSGGMVMGTIASEDALTRELCAELGCAAVSVEYRLAPEHPHPAPVEDCWSALAWMAAEAPQLRIDPQRIAVYGASAGGGLVAGTALLARDRGGPEIALQMILFPMLDDRCDTPSGREIEDLGVFDGWASRAGFRELLGERAGTDEVDHYAAPARCEDLSGLPPAWVDVGELDSLRDETILYAQRLMQAGVATELRVNAGCFHGSENIAPDAASSKRIVAERRRGLRQALFD